MNSAMFVAALAFVGNCWADMCNTLLCHEVSFSLNQAGACIIILGETQASFINVEMPSGLFA